MSSRAMPCSTNDAQPRVGLYSLPIELVSAILSESAVVSERRRSYQDLMLVCKAFTAPARRLLHRDLLLLTRDQVDGFLQAINIDGTLSSATRRLTLIYGPRQPTPAPAPSPPEPEPLQARAQRLFHNRLNLRNGATSIVHPNDIANVTRPPVVAVAAAALNNNNDEDIRASHAVGSSRDGPHHQLHPQQQHRPGQAQASRVLAMIPNLRELDITTDDELGVLLELVRRPIPLGGEAPFGRLQCLRSNGLHLSWESLYEILSDSPSMHTLKIRGLYEAAAEGPPEGRRSTIHGDEDHPGDDSGSTDQGVTPWVTALSVITAGALAGASSASTAATVAPQLDDAASGPASTSVASTSAPVSVPRISAPASTLTSTTAVDQSQTIVQTTPNEVDHRQGSQVPPRVPAHGDASLTVPLKRLALVKPTVSDTILVSLVISTRSTLTHLHLSETSALTRAGLLTILACLPNLLELDLHRCVMSVPRPSDPDPRPPLTADRLLHPLNYLPSLCPFLQWLRIASDDLCSRAFLLRIARELPVSALSLGMTTPRLTPTDVRDMLNVIPSGRLDSLYIDGRPMRWTKFAIEAARRYCEASGTLFSGEAWEDPILGL